MSSNLRPIKQFKSSRSQQGVGLVEVLIAVLIMGIGMLGVAAMQATALRNSQSSLERSQAVVQTYAIFDAMRANRAAAIDDAAYNTAGMACAAPTGTSLAQTDSAAWITDLKTTLGAAACGQITCAANNCLVTVQWDESRATDNGTTAAPINYSIRTRGLL